MKLFSNRIFFRLFDVLYFINLFPCTLKRNILYLFSFRNFEKRGHNFLLHESVTFFMLRVFLRLIMLRQQNREVTLHKVHEAQHSVNLYFVLNTNAIHLNP